MKPGSPTKPQALLVLNPSPEPKRSRARGDVLPGARERPAPQSTDLDAERGSCGLNHCLISSPAQSSVAGFLGLCRREGDLEKRMEVHGTGLGPSCPP